MYPKNKLVLLAIILLCIADAIFAQPKTVSYLTEPSFSPDRKEIVFVSGGDIWTVPSEGGTATLLVSHPANESRPMFSPDGTRLAFISNRTGGGDIYVLNLTAGELTRITFDDAQDVLDAWSRDGKYLYFSSSSKDIAGMNDVFRVAATGGTPMQVSADRYTSEYFSAPSPDGNSLAFSGRGIANGQWWRNGRSHIDETELWLKRGDSYEQLTTRGAKQLWTMWSADGSRIYYVSDRNGKQNIWTKPLRGTEKQLTDFADGRVLWASISYDGKQIAFERDFKIWTLDTNGGSAKPLAINLRGLPASQTTERINLSSQVREIALSPDGKKIAVTARGEIFAASSKEAGEAVRITDTPAPESLAVWSSDSSKLVYTSERNGKRQLFQYDFGTESETQLTTNGEDYVPVFSPDGKSFAFIRNGRSLMVYDLAARRERELCKLYTDLPPLTGKDSVVWSPDGRWLAFLTNSPETRSYTNVSIVSAQGGDAKPVSFLANSNSGSLSWSSDGSYILFDTSQRTEDGALARIDLKLRTPKFREDQFRDLFRQENPQQRPQTRPQPSPSASPNATPNPQATPAVEDKKAENKTTDESKTTEIVFENIRRRLSLLPVGINVNGQAISPDGKTLLIVASAEGQFNLYTIPLDELANDQSARQITSTPNPKLDAQFSPDSREVYYIENGRINIVSLERRETRPLAVNLEVNTNFALEKNEIFNQAWKFLNEGFYDEKFHGVDWNAVKNNYQPVVNGTRNIEELRRVLNLMVGELNASHLGIGGSPLAAPPTPIGKLGLRFDRTEYENSGRLRINEIIALSPADIVREIKVGDYILAVDGTKIDGAKNFDEALENKVGKRVELEISSDANGANRRKVIVKPINTANEKNLLYRQWVEQNRAYVERTSNGKLGYVHLPDMSAGSLAQLYIDLDAQNQGREGVVVDVRNNNGGFVNPYVIDVLARRGYMNMRERGLWTVPSRSALGQRALERPTILLTNQHSLSDAEDLSEGYRALKLGKIVGEPTASWIIYTWNASAFDGTSVRIPRQLVTDNNGKNMELSPRPVDIAVTRPLGETLTGRDSQLDAAVKELLAQIGK